MNNNERVLVVDDDVESARSMSAVLESGRFEVSTKTSGRDALAACQTQEFGAVVTDLHLGEMDGFDFMAQLKQIQPLVPIIFVSGDTSLLSAVDAIKRGAYHYLAKPYRPPELRAVVEQASATRAKLRAREPGGLRVRARRSELIGRSAPMEALRARIELVARSTWPVLITGETGTGKELAARAIHAASERSKMPFVAVNASAIPEALLENEMFGHARGAFTGATHSHRGYFAQADGGTILLDEIGDMPLGLQAKLLRVLQSGEIHPVGAGRAESVDVRVLAATHRRLPDLVAEGRFREDLYYRLNVIGVSLPPLRERPGDVADLAAFFFASAREEVVHAQPTSMRDDLVEMLEKRRWPGNVRQLESAIARLVVLAQSDVLTPEHLALIEDEQEVAAPSRDYEPCTIDDLVRRHVRATLSRTSGNKPQAARVLGVDVSTLYRWQQKWARGRTDRSPREGDESASVAGGEA